MDRDGLLALAALFDEACERAAMEDALRSLRVDDNGLAAAVPVWLNHDQAHTIRAALRARAEELTDDR